MELTEAPVRFDLRRIPASTSYKLCATMLFADHS